MTKATQRAFERFDRKADIDQSMEDWLKYGGNIGTVEAAPAVTAGLIEPSESTLYRYKTTRAGRDWLIERAMKNGSTRNEAIRSLESVIGVGE